MGSLLSCDVWYQNGSYVSVQVHLLEGRSKSDQMFSFWYSPMHKDQLNKEQKVVSLSVFRVPCLEIIVLTLQIQQSGILYAYRRLRSDWADAYTGLGRGRWGIGVGRLGYTFQIGNMDNI